MKIISVVGARPNFMKIAPLVHAIEDYNQSIKDKGEAAVYIDHKLVHTGQHYDDKMSRAFFRALSIPEADINLGIGSGTHAEQVGHTMIAFEKVLKEHKPDWVIVVGDVNATCACSITAKKEHVKVAHVEAGLRSFDLKMPEEINRMVTDRLSDLLLTPCRISGENLKAEGVSNGRVRFVGNIMIDTLEAQREKASSLDIGEIILQGQLVPDSITKMPSLDRYAVMTLHRPSNVDTKEVLEPIVNFLCDEVAADMPLLWPIHPRAKKQLETFGLWEKVVATENLILLHPLGYHELLRLNMDAAMMLTDSGGLQEECCVLGTPCLTMRWNTERPVTLQEHGGASVLVGNNVDRLREAYRNTLKMERNPQRPELWDGRTAQRIVESLLNYS
ncbi:MAG: UDP-N-acetylglucosamine 2-epimerase (non-hydrolyzing) [Phycisphaeraceae bacterium]|nr:UDP-N-acetylglucosamine 2-epimerase (non-hydrolyzing) [Phycisphaeraceae bacterium]